MWAMELYNDLYTRQVNKAQACAVGSAEATDFVVQRQQVAATALSRKRGEKLTPVIHLDTLPEPSNMKSPFETPSPFPPASRASSNALGFPMSSKKGCVRLGGMDDQSSIEAAMERTQQDV